MVFFLSAVVGLMKLGVCKVTLFILRMLESFKGRRAIALVVRKMIKIRQLATR